MSYLRGQFVWVILMGTVCKNLWGHQEVIKKILMGLLGQILSMIIPRYPVADV